MTNPVLCLLLPVLAAIQVHNHVGFIHFNEPVPTFLSDMSLRAQFDYKVIVENVTIPIKSKNAQLKTWAKTYNVTTQFTQFSVQQNTTKIQVEKNVTQVISQLASVNSQIFKILENDTLSVQDQRLAVEELSEQQYSQEVSALLFIRRLIDPYDALSSSSSSSQKR